jgi:hypothetical protein
MYKTEAALRQRAEGGVATWIVGKAARIGAFLISDAYHKLCSVL